MSPMASTPTSAGGVNTYVGVSNPTLQMWIARRQRSQELKQKYEADWARFWKWYRNWVEPLNDPADWWRSNEAIPTNFKIIETLLPRLILGMFDSPDWFSVEARNGRNEPYEYLVKNLLSTTVEEMNLFPKLYEAMKYGLIMGHCWGKVVWKESWTKRQIMRPRLQEDPLTGEITEGVDIEVVEEQDFNGVDFEWRPLDRIFPDPTGDGEWYIEEIDTTLEKLLETQKYLKIYNQAELNRFVASIPPQMQRPAGDSLSDARSGTSAGVSVEYSREPESTEAIPNRLVTPMRDGVGVKLWQCWGWVPQELRGSDGSAWRLTVIAEGKWVLRDGPAPTPDGKPPYFPIKTIPIPGILYGDSPLRYIGPLADQQSRIANMRLDEVYLGVWQQFILRKDSLASDNQMLIQPGGVIEVNTEPGRPVADSFARLDRTPVLPDAYNEDQYRQVQAEHSVAASDIMQGVSASDRQTATEVERRVQQGNARHMLQQLWNNNTVKKELLERTWQWLQMRLTQPKIVRMMGNEQMEVDLTQIQIPIDIVVEGGIFALSKETRIQMDQELVQLAASPAFSMWMKPAPILRRLLQDRGWKNVAHFIKTDEEVMVEQMLAAGMQMDQAAQQAQQAAMVRGAGKGGNGASSGAGGTPGSDLSGMQAPGNDASMVGGSSQGG